MTNVGIIGGKGRMGSALADFFRNQGHMVFVSDRRTKLSNRELVKRVDVVIVAVPIDRTQTVIRELAPYLKEGQLLMDVTSIKEMPVKEMLRSKANVIGLHPMCNETTFGAGQTLLYCPAHPGKWGRWLTEAFEKRGGFRLVKMTPQKHDEQMAFVQALIHFSEIVLGKTLKELKAPFSELLTLASPASQLQFKLAARHLAQDPNLYGNIQIQNAQNPRILAHYRKAVDDLYEIVESKDLKKFTRYFNGGKKYFGAFAEQAFRETDGILHRMIGEPSPKAPPRIPKNAIVSLGPAGTFSGTAAEKWRGKRKDPILYLNQIEEVIRAVARGKAAVGVVPIENRLYGTVRETMDALFLEKVAIIGEFKLPIHQCLAYLKGSVLSEIRTIMSHPQALNQCSRYLKKHFPNAKWALTTSTAAAFEYLHKHRDPRIAAIGPEVGAVHWGLKLHARSIENDSGNETTFIAVARQPLKRMPASAKTSIVFYFSKNRPGSLSQVFEIFAQRGINLSRIESRPAPKKLGEYLFYLDFQASAYCKEGAEALAEVKKCVDGLKWLGSY